jgi:hypothetical protein
MNSKKNEDSGKEPRWLALTAMMATGLVYAALPSNLSVGPRWLLLAVIAAVVVPALISHRAGHHNVDKMLGYFASGILTIAMIWSLGSLVAAIPKHEIAPKILLQSAVALWITNILSRHAFSVGEPLAARIGSRNCHRQSPASKVDQ